jgi:branched-chain amino acid aminotransferase
MHECVRRAGLREAYVEVLCTRGRPAPGSRDPRTCRNTFMAFAIPSCGLPTPTSSAVAST